MLGISVGGRAPLTVAVLADYFGVESLGKILGLFALFSGLVARIGSPYAGWVYSIQGGHAALLVFAGLSLVGMVCFLKSRRPVTAHEEH